MAKIDPPTKAQIEAANAHNQKKEVQRDIRKIDTALQTADPAEMEALHRYLDGKYQYVIADWGRGMDGYFTEHGFNYEFLDADSLRDNLSLMKPKLEAFMHGWNAIVQPVKSVPVSTPDVTVTVNNNVTVNVTFEQVRKEIEDMAALSREQTDEILERINELEEISKENSSKKAKWEKVRPIIAFALDKGVDVAIAILSLVMQMKLGL